MDINKKFYLDLENDKKDIDHQLSRKVRILVFDVFRGLITYPENGIDGTPRDTARAVSAWMVSLGAPSQYSPPEDLQSYSLSAAEESMNSTDFSSPYHVFYITNNVEYIVVLNEGHSNQVAQHWIERIFQAGVAKFARTK